MPAYKSTTMSLVFKGYKCTDVIVLGFEVKRNKKTTFRIHFWYNLKSATHKLAVCILQTRVHMEQMQ